LQLRLGAVPQPRFGIEFAVGAAAGVEAEEFVERGRGRRVDVAVELPHAHLCMCMCMCM